MKMFRFALAGALSAFVLLVCIQLNARVKVAAPSQSRQLLFEDRVAYQRAIEEVYWRHRIWPNNRPDPKPLLDAVMSQATIEQKVQDYLRHSELLEQEWQNRSRPSNCRLRWIGWRSIANSPRCCASSLQRSAIIPLSSPSVWPGRCSQNALPTAIL